MIKKIMVFLLLISTLPTIGWAKAPSNEELYLLIKELEQKLDASIKETQKAKEELARLKAAPKQESVVVTDQSSVRVPEKKEGFVVSLEALYLQPSRSGLDVAVYDPFRTGNIRGDYINTDPDYGLGVRAGIKYDFSSASDLGIRYTWLTADSNIAASRGSADLWGTWLHPNAVIDDNDVTDVAASFDFDYSVIDIVGGKDVDVGPDFGLRFEAGLRHALINQDLSIEYLQTVTPVLYRKVDIEHSNRFSGWGPRLGMDMSWKLPQGFSLFSSIGGSLLVGDFKMSLKEDDWNVGAVNPTTRVGINQEFKSRIVPVIETRAGISYAYQSDSRYSIGAKIGYEWQNWFNMVTMARGSDDVDSQLMDTDTTDIGLGGFFLEGFVKF